MIQWYIQVYSGLSKMASIGQTTPSDPGYLSLSGIETSIPGQERKYIPPDLIFRRPDMPLVHPPNYT